MECRRERGKRPASTKKAPGTNPGAFLAEGEGLSATFRQSVEIAELQGISRLQPPILVHGDGTRAMAGQTNLIRRQTTYYFRCLVPSDLVGRMGRQELRRSLRTRSPARARILGARARILADALFEQVRQRPMTKDEIDQLVRLFYQRQLEEHVTWRHIADAGPELAAEGHSRHFA